MWTLFILSLLGGDTITVEARGPYESRVACETARAELAHPPTLTLCERRQEA